VNGADRHPLSAPLAVGSRVRYDGETYEVVAIDGVAVRLRTRTGGLALVATRELASAEVLDVPDGPDGERGVPSLRADELEGLPDDVREKARERLAHIREAETGFRSGDPEDPATGEPHPEYDQRFASLTARIKAKAAELGVSESTLHNWRRGYEERGLMGLRDGRKGRSRSPGGNLDPRAREEMLAVVDGLARRSNASMKRIFEEVRMRLDEKYGNNVVALPSRSTLHRRLEEMTQGKGTFGSAKRRREAANRPETPYQSFAAARPGETVLIDATQLDVFALDASVTPPRWTSLELVVALDLFTRSILAWRFLPRGTKAVDAALLLRDIIVPKAMRPHWPDSTRWPYHGVPERLVLGAYEGLKELAGVPVVKPQTVVVDGAHAFDSTTFREACSLLGISIQPARPYRPTDKAHVETMFRSIRLGLLERMPGYKGPDLFSRGERGRVLLRGGGAVPDRPRGGEPDGRTRPEAGLHGPQGRGAPDAGAGADRYPHDRGRRGDPHRRRRRFRGGPLITAPVTVCRPVCTRRLPRSWSIPILEHPKKLQVAVRPNAPK
jgi:transposase InsO family protein